MSDEEWEIVDNPQRRKREARKERRAVREAAEEAVEHQRELELEAEAYARELSQDGESSAPRGVVGAASAPLKRVPAEPEFTRVAHPYVLCVCVCVCVCVCFVPYFYRFIGLLALKSSVMEGEVLHRGRESRTIGDVRTSSSLLRCLKW